jgi:hypothetical protein
MVVSLIALAVSSLGSSSKPGSGGGGASSSAVVNDPTILVSESFIANADRNELNSQPIPIANQTSLSITNSSSILVEHRSNNSPNS